MFTCIRFEENDTSEKGKSEKGKQDDWKTEKLEN